MTSLLSLATVKLFVTVVAMALAAGAGAVWAGPETAPGRLDPTFIPRGLPAGAGVSKILVQADNKILLVVQAAAPRLKRLNPDGSDDQTFTTPTFNSPSSFEAIGAVAWQNDRILVGGDFTSVNGNPVNRIGRVHQQPAIS